MLKKDVESSLCIYDKAIRSLPLHTSTQRCDRCTCTHAHTHTPIQRYNRCFFSLCPHTPTQTYNRCTSTQTYTAKRSLRRLNRLSNMTADASMQVSFFQLSNSELGREDHCDISWQDQISCIRSQAALTDCFCDRGAPSSHHASQCSFHLPKCT